MGQDPSAFFGHWRTRHAITASRVVSRSLCPAPLDAKLTADKVIRTLPKTSTASKSLAVRAFAHPLLRGRITPRGTTFPGALFTVVPPSVFCFAFYFVFCSGHTASSTEQADAENTE